MARPPPAPAGGARAPVPASRSRGRGAGHRPVRRRSPRSPTAPPGPRPGRPHAYRGGGAGSTPVVTTARSCAERNIVQATDRVPAASRATVRGEHREGDSDGGRRPARRARPARPGSRPPPHAPPGSPGRSTRTGDTRLRPGGGTPPASRSRRTTRTRRRVRVNSSTAGPRTPPGAAARGAQVLPQRTHDDTVRAAAGPAAACRRHRPVRSARLFRAPPPSDVIVTPAPGRRAVSTHEEDA